MNSSDFYTIKEIIIGSRHAYLENEKYLKMLRELCDSYDKSVNDFYFYVDKVKDKKPEILCNYIENLKTLKGILIYLMHNYYNEDVNFFKNNGKYITDSNYNSVFVKEDNIEKFLMISNQILNSNFANNMASSNIFKKNEYGIYVSPSKINIKNYDDGYRISFDYNSRKDCINIGSNKKVMFDESIIDYFLDLQIPSEALSNYHKQIISDGISKIDTVNICSDNNLSNNIDLNILENNGKFVLSKIK